MTCLHPATRPKARHRTARYWGCRFHLITLSLTHSTICEVDMEAVELFESTLRWLQNRYRVYHFYKERDVVHTIYCRVVQQIKEADLPYRMKKEYTVLECTRTDLAILAGDSIEVAAEFKYEPSHKRRTDRGGDISPSKLDPSVVYWTEFGEGSVEKDVQRVRDYVERGNVKTAFSVFIDEGGRFRHGDPHPGSEWVDWGQDVWVLQSKVER